MPSAPTPSNEPGNPSAIIERLNSQKIEALFALRKKGAWKEEIKQCKGRLGDREELLDHITPDSRKTGKYSTRTSVLLLSGGLESNSKDFTLAKDVMKQLIAKNRPDVVAWTLLRFYKEKFGEYKDNVQALSRQIKNGEVFLPEDYHEKVNLLKELDQYEWVGDKSQAKKFQTPLKPITDEVVKAIGVIKQTPIQLMREPAATAPSPDQPPDSNALAAIRANLEQAKAAPATPEPALLAQKVVVKGQKAPFQQNTPEAALLSKGIPEELISFARDQGENAPECLNDLSKLDFTGGFIKFLRPRITGAIGSDVQSRFITENKFIQAALNSNA